MSEKPLSVAICALIKDNKILFIKRIRGDYVGMWGMPGGKIEKHEHLSEAALREIKEESGIDAEFKEHLGVISEHLIENDNVSQHFLLHLCELEPRTTEITCNQEGKLAWFNLDKLEEMKDQVIPSDLLIIDQMVGRERKSIVSAC